MKDRFLLLIMSLITLSLITGCSTPEEKANRLYVEAIKIMQDANISKTINYSKTYELCKESNKKIGLILSKYPTADMAVEIVSGHLKIGKFTLSEFNKLDDLLKAWAEAEQYPFSCALLIATKIKEPDVKFKALAEVAGRHAEAGQKEKASQIFYQALEAKMSQNFRNNDPVEKARALSDIASIYAKIGQKEKASQFFSHAIETVKAMEYSGYLGVLYQKYDYKSDVICEIAIQCAEVGQLSQALETAKSIKNISRKTDALAYVAGTYAKGGQKETATQILAQAFETIKTSENEPHKARALADIAGKYDKAGEKETAIQIFSQASEAANIVRDAKDKSGVLCDIASEYVKCGHKEKATQLFVQALETAKMVSEVDERSYVLSKIAGEYVNFGQRERAMQLISQALETAKAAKNGRLKFTKNWALGNIALAYADAGQFLQALETAKLINDDEKDMSKVIANISIKYAKNGKFSEALGTVKLIEMADNKSQALAEIACLYAKAGQKPNKEAMLNLHGIVDGINSEEIMKIWE